MKNLLLLRHAKAVTDGAGGDHGRALAPRGRRAAPAMGKAMRKRGLIPDRVLCSTAKRTKETWALVATELKAAPDVEFTDAIYLEPWSAIVKLVRETADTVQTLLVIGHNPGLEDCAAALLKHSASADERGLRDAMAEKFPTGALAVLDCGISHWTDLAPGKATLADFLRPRLLEQS